MAPAGGGGGGQPGRTGGGWGRGREPAAAAAQRRPPPPRRRRRRRRRRSPWRAGRAPRPAPRALRPRPPPAPRALRPPARGRARGPPGRAGRPPRGCPLPPNLRPQRCPPRSPPAGTAVPDERPGAHTRGLARAQSEPKGGGDAARPPPPDLARSPRGGARAPGSCHLLRGWSCSTPAPPLGFDLGPVSCARAPRQPGEQRVGRPPPDPLQTFPAASQRRGQGQVRGEGLYSCSRPGYCTDVLRCRNSWFR